MTKFSLTSKGVLVTGAGGFVGRALAAALFKGRKARRFGGDLADPEYCRRILRGVRTVYYLAGCKKNLRHHLLEPFTFASENVRPFAVFLDCLARSGAKKLIYLSSTIVEYADEAEAPDGYALGKYLNERLLTAFQRQFPIDVKLVRSAAIYGPGDNFDPESANFLPAMIAKTLSAEKEVVVWGDGKRRLQFIYLDDLVKNLLAAERARGDFFVFGNPESRPVNDIVKKIIRLCGKRLRLKNLGGEPDKPTRLSHFKNLILPRISLAEGLRRTIEWGKP